MTEAAGLAPEDAAEAMEYLIQRGLLTGFLGGDIYLTPAGQEVAERASAQPDLSVGGFPAAANVIHVHGDVNAPIQQGGSGVQRRGPVLVSPSLSGTHPVSRVADLASLWSQAWPGHNGAAVRTSRQTKSAATCGGRECIAVCTRGALIGPRHW